MECIVFFGGGALELGLRLLGLRTGLGVGGNSQARVGVKRLGVRIKVFLRFGVRFTVRVRIWGF